LKETLALLMGLDVFGVFFPVSGLEPLFDAPSASASFSSAFFRKLNCELSSGSEPIIDKTKWQSKSSRVGVGPFSSFSSASDCSVGSSAI
jgi:hypothetical protein